MKPLIIANWKMNFNLNEAIAYTQKLLSVKHRSQLLISPPLIYLSYLSSLFPSLNFCAPDVSIFNGGSYTGESSALMIKSCGVNYSLIGHSERRSNFHETNRIIRVKAENCINNSIIPIICIGESIEDRQKDNFRNFLIKQLNESIPQNATKTNIIIAYEPKWAIGSGLIPSFNEIEDVFNFLKTDSNTTLVAKNARMVYGGSVNSKNCKQILSVQNNSGLLIGNASLNETELRTILN